MPKVILMSVVLVAIVVVLGVQIAGFNSTTASISMQSEETAPLVPPEDKSGFESIMAAPGPTDPSTNPFREVLVAKSDAVEPPRINEDFKPIPEPEIKAYVPLPDEVQIPSAPRLTGVLLGDTPVAVFLVDGTSHTASVGDRLPNGYRVLEITDGGALVAFGARRIKLRIGE
ncbi:MAG TPA: hypothetical protein VK934_02975 [Fimbriimonas sp.]|nr:hypothetical protein [Fimbriimonas sp.]